MASNKTFLVNIVNIEFTKNGKVQSDKAIHRLLVGNIHGEYRVCKKDGATHDPFILKDPKSLGDPQSHHSFSFSLLFSSIPLSILIHDSPSHRSRSFLFVSVSLSQSSFFSSPPSHCRHAYLLMSRARRRQSRRDERNTDGEQQVERRVGTRDGGDVPLSAIEAGKKKQFFFVFAEPWAVWTTARLGGSPVVDRFIYQFLNIQFSKNNRIGRVSSPGFSKLCQTLSIGFYKTYK